MLGADPDEKQEEVLRAVQDGERRISIRSGHGVGKTTVLGWCIICMLLTRFPQKTVATAPTAKQLFEALAAETKAWIKKLPPELLQLYDIKSESIHLLSAPEESFASFRTSNPETPEALAGVHSEHVLLIGDEASGIAEQVFEAAFGSMSGHNATTLLAGNPVRSSGTFFDTHHKLHDLWRTIHISCIGHPRCTEDFMLDAERRYGRDSNAWRVRVEGEFPKGDEDTVIPLALVEAAYHRDVLAISVKDIWGVDCGRYGNDPSALAVRRGNFLREPVTEWKGLSTMELVGRIKAKYETTPISERPTDINVDVIGIGAGVVDRLIELGLPARGINVSEAPSLGERYLNLRAELWFKGKDWLEKRDCSLNSDEKTGAELVGPRFKYTSSGKIQVESKDDMKKRHMPSPNRADAFLLTLASDAISASEGPNTRSSWKEALSFKLKSLV